MNTSEAIDSLRQGNRLREVSTWPTADPFDRQYYQMMADGRIYCFQQETSCAAKLIWSWTPAEFAQYSSRQYGLWEGGYGFTWEAV